MDDPGEASHGLADGRGGVVVNVNVGTDGALSVFQERDDRVASGVLEEPDQPRVQRMAGMPPSAKSIAWAGSTTKRRAP